MFRETAASCPALAAKPRALRLTATLCRNTLPQHLAATPHRAVFAAPHPPGIPRPFLYGPAAAQPALLAFQP